jgi:hypothetical protein
MPYALRGDCVIRSDTGAVVKCHSNHAKALAHLRALKVNVEMQEAQWRRIDEMALDSLHGTLKLEESAKTAGYAVTPHPFGKPGGPGLWKHKGLMLPSYIQNLAHGIQKGGKSESTSIATAIAAVKRWAAGGGDVHPEVRAAAAAALAQWEALKAGAHAGTAAKSAGKAATK